MIDLLGPAFSSTLLRMTAKRLGIALVLALAACQTQDPCARSGTACGGDPTGTWQVVGACREPVYLPPVPITYDNQPASMARQSPPEPTSSDWCSGLTYDPGRGLTNFVFPHDALALSNGGQVNYNADGSFGAILSLTGYGQVDLSATCLQRFGVVPTCDQLGTKLETSAANDGSYHDVMCSDDGDLGCHCTYRITFNPAGGALNGVWSANGTVLNHFASGFLLPSLADYCVDPSGTMTLWSHDQTDLWEQAGLRMVVLQHM